MKARRLCLHEYELEKRHGPADGDDHYPLGGLRVRIRPVAVYRCRLCGKRVHEDQ